MFNILCIHFITTAFGNEFVLNHKTKNPKLKQNFWKHNFWNKQTNKNSSLGAIIVEKKEKRTKH